MEFSARSNTSRVRRVTKRFTSSFLAIWLNAPRSFGGMRSLGASPLMRRNSASWPAVMRLASASAWALALSIRLPASSTASEARARFSTPTTSSSRSDITRSSVAYNLAMPIWPSASRAARCATFGSTLVVEVRNPATAWVEGTARFTMRVRERMVGSTSWALGAHSSQMQCSAGSSISFKSTLVVRSSMRSTSSMMMMRHGAVAGICSEVVMISRT